MLAFPQLATGTCAQYPLRTNTEFRTVFNQYNSTVTYKHVDIGYRFSTWELHLRQLTNAERATVQTFFDSVEGRLKWFTFLDPTDNLVARSQDFGAAIWVKDAGMIISGGQSDPLGSTSATLILNSGVVARRMTQRLLFQVGIIIHSRCTAAWRLVD